MRYLHTMVRVKDLDASLKFWGEGLGLKEVRRMESEKGRFTLVFLAAPGDAELSDWDGKSNQPPGIPCVELTYNWDTEDYEGGRNFGHLAFVVDDIYAACTRLQDMGVTINRPPREGRMAFVKSPDGISIELLQSTGNLEVAEPWASMENIGSW